jgi:hypothetical protein
VQSPELKLPSLSPFRAKEGGIIIGCNLQIRWKKKDEFDKSLCTTDRASVFDFEEHMLKMERQLENKTT